MGPLQVALRTPCSGRSKDQEGHVFPAREDADLFTIDPDAGTLAFKTPDYEALLPRDRGRTQTASSNPFRLPPPDC